MSSDPAIDQHSAAVKKMRWLNPDRNPCVQCSIRSLGFNFTDWFAPFFSVHILTRKVASAEPLYCACLWMSWDDCYGNKHAHIGWKWHWASCQGHVQPSCNLTPLCESLGADRDETIESGHREQATRTALRGSSGSTWCVLFMIFLRGEWQRQTEKGWRIG